MSITLSLEVNPGLIADNGVWSLTHPSNSGSSTELITNVYWWQT